MWRFVTAVARRRPSSVRLLAPVLACSLVLAACLMGGTATASGHGSSDSKYGASPQQGSGITYQPDVVLVGGAGSVKSVSSNGLVWTISGSAPNVGDLRPGKILFASSLGVGRILAISKSGSNKKVVLGPVPITDIVRDGDFSSSTAMSLGSAEAYSVPDQPGLLSQTPGSSTSSTTTTSGTSVTQSLGGRPDTVTLPTVHFVAYTAGHHPAQALPALSLGTGSGGLPSPSSTPSSSSVGAYHLTPFCCAGGVGVHVGYNDKGLKMSATVTLHLDKPTVAFDLKIAGGKLVNAGVELHGAGGFGVALSATSTTGLAGDVSRQHVQIPVDFSIPVPGFPIPLTIGMDQVFGLTAAFTARPSTFTASGNYSFGGSIGFGIHNGSPSVYLPQGVAPTTKPTSTMNLVSVGPAAVLINYEAKLSVGVGLLGFRTGTWFALAFNTGLTENGATSDINCRSAAFAIFAEYGVGYSIPKPVTALFNTFLKVFHAPPIQSSGGYASQPITVYDASNSVPAIAACA